MTEPSPKKKRKLCSLEATPKGLVCPGCGCIQFRVLSTWAVKQNAIRRRRQCRNCGREFGTSER